MVVIYAKGLAHCSVCAPGDMPKPEVERWANFMNPTGIDSQWTLSADKAFASGQPNPCPCEKDSGRVHWLMDC